MRSIALALLFIVACAYKPLSAQSTVVAASPPALFYVGQELIAKQRCTSSDAHVKLKIKAITSHTASLETEVQCWGRTNMHGKSNGTGKLTWTGDQVALTLWAPSVIKNGMDEKVGMLTIVDGKPVLTFVAAQWKARDGLVTSGEMIFR